MTAAPPASSADGQPDGELVDVTFPQMGDSVTEGTVLEWRKQVGDNVAAEEELVEISTDKVDAEVPSPLAGTIAEILVGPDETVPVGAVLCRIAASAGAAASSPQQPSAEPAEIRPEGSTEAPAPSTPAGNGEINATPVAVRIANAHGVDLGSVPGTGPRGRITKDDVIAATEGEAAPRPRPQRPRRPQARPRPPRGRSGSPSAARRPRSCAS